MRHSKKLFGNKRAISEFILDIWSYIIFAVAIFFFFVVFKLEALNAAQRELKGISDVSVSSSTLTAYLRTPITIDGKEINFAELIRLWRQNPDNYEKTLRAETEEILNKLEYEYISPQTKNIRVRGFNIVIQKEALQNDAISPILEFKSKSYESGLCIIRNYGCAHLGKQFIPISEGSYLYVILMESEKAK